MYRRSWLFAVAAVALILRAGDTARKPEDYAARVKIGPVVMGAENLGPGVPAPQGGIFTRDYIVIEVAVFGNGAARTTVTIAPSEFALRINGSRTLLRPDTPGAVAASLKYPDWERHPQLEATAGIGDAAVILGRPRPVERFPGDHRPAEQQGGGGSSPRIESPLEKKGDPASIDELVQRAALPGGNATLPVVGCLYFPFRGKLKSVKKLELIYEGTLGEGSIRIR